MQVNEKVAIITGGASGIGRETCLLFAKQGAKVVVADFDFEKAMAVKEEILNDGGNAIALKVDVTNQQEVKQMVDCTIDSFGTIDILINNAGVTNDALLVRMTEEQWDQVVDVNLKGVFLCTKAVAPILIRKRFGRIISTSSISANGNFGQTNYAATKAGIRAMTKTWAKEFGRSGVTANAVAPGFVETPMTQSMKPEVLEKIVQNVPARRLGVPFDIAYTYLFLASEEASYINGAIIEVDGGLTI